MMDDDDFFSGPVGGSGGGSDSVGRRLQPLIPGRDTSGGKDLLRGKTEDKIKIKTLVFSAWYFSN